jgi:hypothetical protein
MTLFEVGSFVPKRSGHDVYLSVAIEIGKIGSFSPEFIGELDFFERVKNLSAEDREFECAEERANREKLEHIAILEVSIPRVNTRKRLD